MSSNFNAVALCAVGAEKTVSNEMRKLNLVVSESAFGQVRFKADLPGLYRSLMGLRAADRVLLEVAWFPAADFDELFDGVKEQPWEALIHPGMGLKVSKVRTNRSQLEAETSIQAIVHKAAAERICIKRKINRLPETGNEAELRVYIEKDKASILLDLSGDPLFKRGYRISGGIAPLRETTAAAIILHSGWRRKFPLYDPFFGSGTVAIEAALYAWDIPPGIGRNFALNTLLLSNRNIELQIKQELLEKVDFSRLVRIAGSDSEAAIISAAKSNMERAIEIARGKGKAGQQIQRPIFKNLAMSDATPPEDFKNTADLKNAESTGFIITNPPYGRRLGDAESAEKTYAEMGRLADNFPGWKLVLITDHPGFESFFGKKADSCREITNGAIQSYLYQYESL
jgi:putative N6-adenine-specific DNA methylase